MKVKGLRSSPPPQTHTRPHHINVSRVVSPADKGLRTTFHGGRLPIAVQRFCDDETAVGEGPFDMSGAPGSITATSVPLVKKL